MAQTGGQHWRRAVMCTFATIFVVSLLAGLLGSLTRGALAIAPAPGHRHGSAAAHSRADDSTTGESGTSAGASLPVSPHAATEGQGALLQLSDLPAGWVSGADAGSTGARVAVVGAPRPMRRREQARRRARTDQGREPRLHERHQGTRRRGQRVRLPLGRGGANRVRGHGQHAHRGVHERRRRTDARGQHAGRRTERDDHRTGELPRASRRRAGAAREPDSPCPSPSLRADGYSSSPARRWTSCAARCCTRSPSTATGRHSPRRSRSSS